MSKNYDNWERLVGAVLLKEELRRIALCDSREPSSISSGSSRFTSPLDDQEFVYKESHAAKFKENLSSLRLLRLNINEVQRMEWTQLEDEIDKWINAARVTIQILFPCEQRLCNSVDLCSMEIIRGSTIQLLNFADAVAIGSRTPERLFKVLDVYETLRDLMPELELIFSDQYSVSLRNIEPITIWKRLGEGIRGIFIEMENLIRRDPAKANPVPGGGLHPITRYVMNYLRVTCRSRLTLEQVFEDSVATTTNLDRSLSPLAVQIAWIMELLESNLKAKSKVYKDYALCAVFMMNNGIYIVQKVRNNELGTLLGDDWIRKHKAKVRQYHGSYQRRSWSKVLGVLKVDNFDSMPPKEEPESLKEKLSLFNSYFKEICKTQSTYHSFIGK